MLHRLALFGQENREFRKLERVIGVKSVSPRPILTRWGLRKLHACNFCRSGSAPAIEPPLTEPFPSGNQLRTAKLLQTLTHMLAKAVGDQIYVPTTAMLTAYLKEVVMTKAQRSRWKCRLGWLLG